MKLHDYLIAHDQADWSAALSGWSWLLRLRIHEQLQDFPDGTEVVLKAINKPE